MSHPRASAFAFLSLTGLLVIVSASALAASWPVAQAAARTQAEKLVGESASAEAAEALVNYRLALLLDPSSDKARLGLAAAQIRLGKPQDALTTLERAGQGSEADELRLRTNIELGRTDPAAGLGQLIGSEASPEAAQRLARVQAGKLPLAAELYAEGLLESSSAILVQLPESFERNFLLGRINYDRHTAASLIKSDMYLKTAIELKPNDLSARRLYAAVLADRGQTAANAQQAELIRRLENQRP